MAGARALLDEKDLPTAILCSHDFTAIGVITTLQDAGFRVPQDVSVVGSDDVLHARLAQPPLTTVRMPRELLGKIAFEALERMLGSERRPGREYVLETQLVIRHSSGPAMRP